MRSSLRAAQAAPLDLHGGTRLGKYEILKRLAIGGMAEIYLARVSNLPGYQKQLVVKRILPQLASKPDFVEMFLDEARIAATLQHPNIVQTFEVAEADGNYFIVMEYLHGEDLRSLMSILPSHSPAMPLQHALNVIIGVAAGLHYAHEKVGFDGRPLEIVHRDANPQNVIISFDGAVKLLDFGIAKATNRFAETRFGTLKGKVPYMSPEQCRSEALDRRSDIFSLGIMLYELTLGRRLYKGQSDFAVLKQIVEGSVTRPRAIDPNYPEALETIVMRALDKDRAARYQTARELQIELEQLISFEQLHVSQLALAQYMEELFGHKLLSGKHENQSANRRDVEDDPHSEHTIVEARIAAERKAFRAQIGRVSVAPATPERRVRPRAVVSVAWLVGILLVLVAWQARQTTRARRSNVRVPAMAIRATPADPPAPPPPPAPPATSEARATTAKPARERRPARPHGDGVLVLASNPWCNVAVDGVDKGPTPLSLKLPAGRHSVALHNSEFGINRILTVTLAPNETMRKRLDFAR
jgi:serine/threonine protein kinase